MKTLLKITLTVLIFSNFSCEKAQMLLSKISASQNSPILVEAFDHMFTPPESDEREKPIVTAHYAQNELPEIQVRELCATSVLYQQTLAIFDFDFEPFCAAHISNKLTKESLWILPQSPEQLIWQQAVRNGEDIAIELEDSNGFPWPSEVTTFITDEKLRIKLVPQFPLPKQKVFRLKAFLKAQNGEVAENWIQEIIVQEGEHIALPWVAKAQPRKIAKQNRKNSRRSG